MKKRYVFLALFFILLVGAYCYFYFNIKVAISNSNQKELFEIKEGESTFEVADRLREKGFIRVAWIFAYYTKLKAINIYPGSYYLRRDMSIDEILEPLQKQQTQEYKIVIPEGYNINDIGDYLEKNNFMKKSDFISAAKDHEGYLFPDTYKIAIDTTAKELVETMLDNFDARTAGLNPTKDNVILASIVEREAKNDLDRAKIAGVYLNRLESGMFLGADPTVQYAKGSWDTITVEDYKGVQSPYNTYINKGLPPGPICNPGLASIKAVLKPEKNGYYYFFHLADGTAIFSKNSQEHDKNIKKYKDQLPN